MPEVVLDALRRFEVETRANVHEGMHRRARTATDAYYKARARVARFLHASSNQEIIFTYGARSSINLFAYSFGHLLEPADEILLSVLEHHGNLVPWQELANRRVVLRFLPMTPEGRLDLGGLGAELTDRCRLVALTHCSNVTDALTDVGRIVAATHAVGAKVMLDGAQGAPHGPLDVSKLDVDFYVFSDHKTYGPTGIGVLWRRGELLETMPPFMTGGQMIEQVTLTKATFRPRPRRFEAGTPPIGAAIGLGAALDWMQALDWRAIRDHELRLTRRLIDGLAATAGVRVLGPVDTRDRRGVVSFAIAGISAERFVASSIAGAWHCVAAIIVPSYWCAHLEGAARASLAPYSVDADVEALLDGVEDLVHNRFKGAAQQRSAGKRRD
jgi:cysteine desulfurase/selenocysteine lyase